MADFNTIIIQTRCEIVLVSGDRSSFTIDEATERAKWVNVSIKNGELVVYTRPEYYGYLLMHGYYPQITITYQTLLGLKMLDRCFVKSKGTLALRRLGIIVREGYLDISVDAFCIDCTVLKGGIAKISGETWVSYVLALDRGKYDGLGLKASEGIVDVHSESQVSVWFTAEMELALFERSKVSYRGNPRMKITQLDEYCALKQIVNNPNEVSYESY